MRGVILRACVLLTGAWLAVHCARRAETAPAAGGTSAGGASGVPNAGRSGDGGGGTAATTNGGDAGEGAGRSGEAGGAGASDGSGGEGGAGGSPNVGDCELVYTEGHGDLFLAFDDGPRLMVRSAFQGDREVLADPERVCVIVPRASYDLSASFGGAPEGDEYAFLGVPPHENFWLLPAVAQAGMPWFGASTEQIPGGRYADDLLRVSIERIDAPEGANVAVWDTSFAGAPAPLFSSAGGILTHAFRVGAHLHFNWSFSHGGSYRFQFRAEGVLAANGTLERSDVAPIRFEVEP